jgi:hypothetical protein
MYRIPNNINLFALLDDSQTPVWRIPLTAGLSTELAGLFAAQKNDLIVERQAIEFTGSYNVDTGEIFSIADYPIPDAISNAIGNPLTCPVLDLNTETHRIKALFAGVWDEQVQTVSFQVFDSGKLLKRGITIIGSGNTYKKLEEPGLVLQDKLTAYFDKGILYFV